MFHPHEPSLQKLENIILFEFNLEFAQQRQILILKRTATMMFLLVLYVPNDDVEL